MHEFGGTVFAVAAFRYVRQNISTSAIPLPMAEMIKTGAARVNVSVGHLSVHVEGAHPADVPFLFEQQQKRLGPAFVAALIWHVAAVAFIILAIKYSPVVSTTS